MPTQIPPFDPFPQRQSDGAQFAPNVDSYFRQQNDQFIPAANALVTEVNAAAAQVDSDAQDSQANAASSAQSASTATSAASTATAKAAQTEADAESTAADAAQATLDRQFAQAAAQATGVETFVDKPAAEAAQAGLPDGQAVYVLDDATYGGGYRYIKEAGPVLTPIGPDLSGAWATAFGVHPDRVLQRCAVATGAIDIPEPLFAMTDEGVEVDDPNVPLGTPAQGWVLLPPNPEPPTPPAGYVYRWNNAGVITYKDSAGSNHAAWA